MHAQILPASLPKQRIRLGAFLGLVLSLTSVALAAAPTNSAATATTAATATVAGADTTPAETLTLREALVRAFSNNFNVRIARLDPLIALEDLRAEGAAWDPMFFVETRYDDSTKRQNSLEFTSTGTINPDHLFFEESFSTRSGFGGRMPFGTEWKLYSEVKKLTNTINRQGLPNALFSPEYETFTGVEITQPLLQGFGFSANLARYRIAESRLDQERFTRRTTLTNTAVEVINAYYDLVFGQENLLAKQEAVRLAEQLVDESRRRLDAGRMTPVDVGRAEVRLGEANEEAILAADFLRERRIKLLRLTLPKAPSGALPTFAVEGNLPAVPSTFDGAALQQTALTHRPDYLGRKAEVAQANARQSLARNRRLPRVDLQANFGYSGLERNTDYAYRDLFDNHRAQWGVGLSFSMPIGNREAAANQRSAERNTKRAELRVEELELNVQLDVTNAIGRLAALRERLATAENSARVADEALTAETRRLEAGQVTTFAVAEMQEKTSASRSRLLAARVDIVKALSELHAVTGTLLTENGFTFGNEDEFKTPGRAFWLPSR